MARDSIAELEIDEFGKLHVVPLSRSFPYIYREVMEVHWDTACRSLYSPSPREWSYSPWLQQILAAARAQNCELQLASDTKWLSIGPRLKADFLRVIDHGV